MLNGVGGLLVRWSTAVQPDEFISDLGRRKKGK